MEEDTERVCLSVVFSFVNSVWSLGYECVIFY